MKREKNYNHTLLFEYYMHINSYFHTKITLGVKITHKKKCYLFLKSEKAFN
jgi:hypothetical protein